MDKTNIELAQLLISKSYVQQGVQSLQQRQNLIKDILSQVNRFFNVRCA